MRLLDRYLLRELLIPLGFCLCGFLIFWIAFDLVNELGQFQNNNMRVRDVAEYYLVRLPEILVLILPVALLLALLYSLTNHARHNELTAVRAAGVSLARISAPYVAVGLCFTAALFVCNEYWVPDSAEKAEQIKLRHSGRGTGGDVHQGVHFINSRDQRHWWIEAYDVKQRRMTGPDVVWTLSDGSNCHLRAERGEWTGNSWTFYGVKEYTNAPRADPILSLQTNVLAVPELTETPDQIGREIKIGKKLENPDPRAAEMSIAELLDYLSLHPAETARNRWWLYTQLQGRLAMPWTCLVVVLVAIPFGAASGRRNVYVGVAGSLVICFAFFVLQRISLAFGTGGYLPAWLAAWLPNLVFAITGLWLLLRVR
jgi:lipopolysaccharide export system permease protein